MFLMYVNRGGWALAQAFADPDTLDSFVCGCSPHPSLTLEDGAYGGSSDLLASRIARPMLFLPASNDPDCYREGGSIYESMRSRDARTETDATFGDMSHGWTMRGDLADEAVRKQVVRAFDITAAYFDKLLR